MYTSSSVSVHTAIDASTISAKMGTASSVPPPQSGVTIETYFEWLDATLVCISVLIMLAVISIWRRFSTTSGACLRQLSTDKAGYRRPTMDATGAHDVVTGDAEDEIEEHGI